MHPIDPNHGVRSGVRSGIEHTPTYPVSTASDMLSRCPPDANIAMLVGLVPQLPGASAMCRITTTTLISGMDPSPVDTLQTLVDAEHKPSFASGWIFMLGYELGRSIEPKAIAVDSSPSTPPIVALRWEGAWLADGGEPQWVGPRERRFELREQSGGLPPFALGEPVSSMGRGGYIRAVERVLEYIRAGDIYQANIAHHIRVPFEGSTRGAASALFSAADPAFGAAFSFEHAGQQHQVVSVSPELFLSFDPATRILSTRPMKGTRPGTADPAELMHASKDRAELNMIIDLMRNDLGRVCNLGSVRVTRPRTIEHHGSGVLQATASVEGVVRDPCALQDILRACFPPGSVTGAPKIRAMQIIDELEGAPRGPYCGSVLVLNDSGSFVSSVGIRTAHIAGDTLSYATGAGIVADSVPAQEWDETMIKAAILERALGVDLGRLRNDP